MQLSRTKVLLGGDKIVVVVIRVVVSSVVVVTRVSKVNILVIVDSLIGHDNQKVEKVLLWS